MARLFLLVRISDGDADQEAVHLRFGQRKRAFEVDGILRGQHEKGTRQGACDAVHRHLALLHRFKERRLRARASAFYSIRQHDLRRQGPRPGT